MKTSNGRSAQQTFPHLQQHGEPVAQIPFRLYTQRAPVDKTVRVGQGGSVIKLFPAPIARLITGKCRKTGRQCHFVPATAYQWNKITSLDSQLSFRHKRVPINVIFSQIASAERPITASGAVTYTRKSGMKTPCSVLIPQQETTIRAAGKLYSHPTRQLLCKRPCKRARQYHYGKRHYNPIPVFHNFLSFLVRPFYGQKPNTGSPHRTVGAVHPLFHKFRQRVSYRPES